MSRENILFSVVGLLLGYVIAFHLVVYVNQNQPVQVASGADVEAGGLPADHPAVSGEDAQQQRQAAAAAEQAAQAAKASPADFDAQTRAAEAYFRAGSFEDAIDFETRANKLRPDDYDTVVRLGNFYSSAGRFEDAARWYTAALEKKPDDCDARSELALTYYMRRPRQPERAITELRRALEIDPNHVPSLHNLTLMLLETKQVGESASVLARLERADPTYDQLPRLREEVEKARKAAPGSSSSAAGGAQKKSPTD
ncbi:MAG TPA: tetratricopeptide repeat protein [Pyrinomonadaceae bacterium]|nr:tetratricopeptide repeat protein [Pyrinomonadaceae bacterium]